MENKSEKMRYGSNRCMNSSCLDHLISKEKEGRTGGGVALVEIRRRPVRPVRQRVRKLKK